MAWETPKPLVVPEDLPPILAESRDELEFTVSSLTLLEGDTLFPRLDRRVRNEPDPAIQMCHVLNALGRATATVMLQQRGGTPGAPPSTPTPTSTP
jgi:hypothetical protein